METTKPNNNLLTEFLSRFEQVPADIITAMTNSSSDADEKNILNSLLPSLSSQFKELSSSITELTGKADKQSMEEVQQTLRISSGLPLMNSLKGSLPSIGSLIGKLGINEIVKAIKKIIRKIFELLGKELPKWLDAILLIIDEIFNMIFGGDSQKTANAFADAELNFLRQMTQLSHLENATYRAKDLREEE